MTLNIAGKCAVVTGSTTGMGQAIIKRLAAAGCNVMLHGLAEEEVMQVHNFRHDVLKLFHCSMHSACFF